MALCFKESCPLTNLLCSVSFCTVHIVRTKTDIHAQTVDEWYLISMLNSCLFTSWKSIRYKTSFLLHKATQLFAIIDKPKTKRNLLGKWPTWCTNTFYVFISIYNSLYVSSTLCSSSGETNCINTASCNSHSVLVAEMCAGWKKAPDDEHDVFETCRELQIEINT
jgi:hypothetical protein